MIARTCYIGLGSNMSQPVDQLLQAVSTIAQLAQTTMQRCSSFYASRPMGPQDQPDYVNAVVKIKTQLAPHDLLSALQRIELDQGRERKGQRWGPRTLDLDILLIDEQVIETEDLIVPHPGMKSREFVLYPLYEIAPDIMLPCGNSLIFVLNNVSTNGLVKIEQDVKWESTDNPKQ